MLEKYERWEKMREKRVKCFELERKRERIFLGKLDVSREYFLQRAVVSQVFKVHTNRTVFTLSNHFFRFYTININWKNFSLGLTKQKKN